MSVRLSLEGIRVLSADTGFRAETLEKVVRLGELVSEVDRHPLLSGALVLKGGTALNLAFGPPARLSVDLDFNCVGFEERERMLEVRPEIERAVRSLARAHAYHVQASGDEHAGRKLFLTYRSLAGTQDRVELDLNFLHRIALVPSLRLPLWQPGDLETPRVAVVGMEELCAGKLCALLARALPRDLYDASRLPVVAANAWGSLRLRRLFVAMAGTLDHPLHSYTPKRFEAVTDDAVVQQLHPMLSSRDKPSAAELREGALEAIASLLELSGEEREYTEAIQQGHLRPELLFPDDEETSGRLRRHPALLWKTKNAASHARRKGGSTA